MIIIIFILGLDQLTKFLISKSLSLNQSILIIKGLFHLTLVHNRGAAFGLLKNQIILLILTSFFAVLLIYFNLKKSGTDKKLSIYKLSLSLILAGALGNLIDRVCFGYVIDFLDFRVWPVFNIADSAISIGAILLGYSLLKQAKK
jgi:signal peptidase II